MAHYAEIDENNEVLRVLVIDDNWSQSDINAFLTSLTSNRWVQTSYNGNFRGHFAGIGHKYNDTLDIFIAPQPYSSWSLNIETGHWESPIPYPEDNNRYKWNENLLTWELENNE